MVELVVDNPTRRACPWSIQGGEDDSPKGRRLRAVSQERLYGNRERDLGTRGGASADLVDFRQTRNTLNGGAAGARVGTSIDPDGGKDNPARSYKVEGPRRLMA